MRRRLCLLSLCAISAGIASAQPGDGSFPILYATDLFIPYVAGLGHDGVDFWVATGDQASGQCQFHIVDEYGGLVTSVPQGGGATGWGCRDLAFDGTHMFGSHSGNVDGYDADYQYVGSFQGCPIHPHRNLAYGQGHFYASGFGTDLYRMEWNGVWGTTAACVDLGPSPVPAATSFAYDEVLDGLWVTAGTHELLRLAWGGGGAIDTFTIRPEYEQARFCTMAHTRFGYVLAVLVDADPATLVLYDLGYAASSGPPLADRDPRLALRVLPSVLWAGNGEVDISFEVPRGPGRDRVDLTILDAAGRLIAAQSMPVPDTRRVRFAWDGFAAGGCLPPAGVYQVRAQAGALNGEGRLLLLR